MTYFKITALVSLLLSGMFAGKLFANNPAAGHLRLEPSPRSSSSMPERNDYQQCRQKALQRSQKLPKDRRSRYLRSAVTQCREQFPAMAVLQDCKKEAFLAYRDHKDYLRTALEQCRQDYQQFVFQPANPLPVKSYKNDIYFAGVGLNFPISLDQLARVSKESDDRRLGNFNCQPLVEVYTKRQPPEHILFGNDIKVYRPFQGVELERLHQALIAQSEKQDEGWTHANWGHILPSSDKGDIPHFFPVAYCQFDKNLGSLFQDIKIYYFLDRDRRAIIPYFGVAFFHEQAQVSRTALLEQLQSELGSEFQAQRENDSFQIVAAEPIDEVDSEGEPFNLCRHPRKHSKIAVIAQHKDSSFASYFLLSNLDNLCKHGDQLASRFLKQGL